ncbi:MAG: hypothetical protein A2Z90_17475 [Burkholderiales bacterium GWA2_64_37]|nr:MAG: hypothetical protein A2Z90_17475 [Burkholderiales bacterium GWA2_64_37]HCE92366.1 hypothetical protein [Acidovorax sp.]
MKRAGSIEALIRRARADFEEVKKSYEASLHEKHVREDLKVSIKNIFENLRSCLDYLAHDVRELKCVGAPSTDRLYFPIRPSAREFSQAVARDFPGLENGHPDVFGVLEAAQPYNDPWLGQFNRLNNQNKHQDLVEQTRTETRQVTVSRGGGSVSWGPGVTFGGGVSVMGVPIDPRTQMPMPNRETTTTVTTWVDFRFAENGQSVLPFLDTSIQHVEQLFNSLRPLV